MAQRTMIVLTDDVQGGDAPATQTVTFALDGVAYVIDLGDDNAARLRGDFLVWTSHARGRTSAKGRRASSGRSAVASSGCTAAVRAWARENGHEVSDRGRIKADVLAAYDAAQR